MKVLFVHGLESGPTGHKARYLAARFETLTPAMDTSDFPACLRLVGAALASFSPDVVVGSSFGGAVTLALLHAGAWRGPTLLLAQAGQKMGLPARLAAGRIPCVARRSRAKSPLPPRSFGLRLLAAPGSVRQV